MTFDYFFDVGAHTGETFDQYLMLDAKYDGWNVFCFEPSPRNFAQLLAKASEMAGRYNVVICPFGLARNNSTRILYEKRDSSEDAIYEDTWVGERYATNKYTPYNIEVAVVPLSFILRCIGRTDRVEVKLDAEGAEYEIIEDLLEEANMESLRKIKVMYVEWHGVGRSELDVPTYAQDLTMRLQSEGIEVRPWEH